MLKAESLGQGVGDFASVFGHDNGAGIDAGAASVLADGTDHHVEVFRPVFDAIGAHQYFAPSRTVNLDGRVAGVLLSGGFIPEYQRTSALIENRRRAVMIGGIKTKSLGGNAGGDEGLDQAIGRPRFVFAGFDDDGRFQGDGGEPE